MDRMVYRICRGRQFKLIQLDADAIRRQRGQNRLAFSGASRVHSSAEERNERRADAMPALLGDRFFREESVDRQIALLSDVHGNLEALQAVLEDIAQHRIEAIYCLGDTVGYGPNPRECLDLAMRWPVVLQGNFDQAVLSGAEGFGLVARRSVEWTRQQLQAPVPDPQTAASRRDFLIDLPHTVHEDDSLFVHGSPHNPLHEYVFPEDVYNERKMMRIFALIDRYCFHGHTHIPGVFTEDMRFICPQEAGSDYHLGDRKALVNVGSVGQPRDSDWRACYVLLEGNVVRFRRTEYDIATTIGKIRDIDDLDNFLGDRLRDGS